MIPNRLLKRLSVRQLQEALRLKRGMDKARKLERLRDKHQKEVTKLQKKIDQLMGGDNSTAAIPKRRRRRFSAATRRKMAEAQKKRWEKAKGAIAGPTPKPSKGRRKMSAETRKKMAEAAKARWAKIREGRTKQAAANPT